MYLYRDPPAKDNVSVRGWSFVVGETDQEGICKPVFDTWEEKFFEIARYPERYTVENILWTDMESGEQLSLEELLSRCT